MIHMEFVFNFNYRRLYSLKVGYFELQTINWFLITIYVLFEETYDFTKSLSMVQHLYQHIIDNPPYRKFLWLSSDLYLVIWKSPKSLLVKLLNFSKNPVAKNF